MVCLLLSDFEVIFVSVNMLLCCRIMDSFGSVDTKGGYHMGKDGIVPANDAIYDIVSDLNSTEILRNEMWKVGNEKIFYTPEMQRECIDYRLKSKMEDIQRARAKVKDDEIYNSLQDQIIAEGGIAWPPPGIYLPQVEDPVENHPENSANNSPTANFQFENFQGDDFQFNFDGDDFQADNFLLTNLETPLEDIPEDSILSCESVCGPSKLSPYTSIICLSSDDESDVKKVPDAPDIKTESDKE